MVGRKNPQFSGSGADAVLERLQRGVQLGCAVCSEEYNTGRSKAKAKHSKECRRSKGGRAQLDNNEKRNDSDSRMRVEDFVDNSQSMCRPQTGDCDDEESVCSSWKSEPSIPRTDSREQQRRADQEQSRSRSNF